MGPCNPQEPVSQAKGGGTEASVLFRSPRPSITPSVTLLSTAGQEQRDVKPHSPGSWIFWSERAQ